MVSSKLTEQSVATEFSVASRLPFYRLLEPLERSRSAFNSTEKDFNMLRYYVATVVLTFFSSTCVIADDYLLRLETVGLRVLPNGDKEPDATIPERSEIVLRINDAFFASTAIGVDKISIRGTVRESKDGKLRLEVHYTKASDTGEFVPGIDGKRHPVRDCFIFDTKEQLIELGKPVVLDALVSNSKRKRLTLLIIHFDPTIATEK